MKKHSRVFAIAASSWMTLAAQPTPVPAPPQQPTPAANQTGRFEGAVVTTAGTPVADARVTVLAFQNGTGQAQNATSGLDGKFAFPALEPGNYTVRVSRPGYVMSFEKSSWLRRAMIKSGEVETAKLTLAPESVISGRVVDSDGEPVELATVQVMKIARLQAGRITNERGEFRIAGLTPGKYLLLATPLVSNLMPEIRADGTREQQDLPAFYPGSNTREGATRVEVSEGGSATGIEIRLGRGPAVSVSGVMRGIDTKKDYPNFFVEPRPQLFGNQLSPRPNIADGRFVFARLAPGHYSMHGVIYGESGAAGSSMPIEFDVGDKNIDNLETDFSPPTAVEGLIKWPDEAKTQDKNIKIRQIQLMRDSLQPGVGNAFAQIGDGNSFHMTGVLRDRYQVVVYTDKGPARVQSIEMDGTPSPDRMLDLTHGSTGTIVITLSAGEGALSGKVENAGPFSTVIALPEGLRGFGMVRRAPIDEKGNYQFGPLPSGEYSVAVIDERDMQEIQGARSLGSYESDAKTVKVGDGEAVTLDLKQP